MFIKFKTETESLYEAQLHSALKQLENLEKTSEDYGKLIDHISTLHKLKAEERRKFVSPETVLVVAANIYGILRITRYERENIVNSKALGFIKKL